MKKFIKYIKRDENEIIVLGAISALLNYFTLNDNLKRELQILINKYEFTNGNEFSYNYDIENIECYEKITFIKPKKNKDN